MIPVREDGAPSLLLQAESAISCNIACVMCPWIKLRAKAGDGLMSDAVWSAIRPHLHNFGIVDLSGGGEPLMNPALAERLAHARHAGCETGFLTNGALLDGRWAERILDADPDWIGFSLDGAAPESYESIRRGAKFTDVVGNLKRLAAMRRGDRPSLLVQAVIMPANLHELEDIVALAAAAGASSVVLKNCDVVRSESEQSRAVYKGGGGCDVKAVRRALKLAQKRANKDGVELKTYAMEPEEGPVCDQDPRRSLFVGYDGRVSPCIGLAYGGEARFFGEKVVIPTVVYGRLPEDDLMALRETGTALKYRNVFQRRVDTYNKALSDVDGDMDLVKLRRILDKAVEAMPKAPEGCDRCHYLYGV